MLPSFVLSSAVAMSGERDGATSTRRRRERRLRSWWRHEQQCARMALTAATHHSAEKVVAGETYSGLRAQKTVRATGARPGVLKDPGQPWVEAVTVGYVAASVPPLGVLLLQGDEGVDAAALDFLEEAEENDIAAKYMELVRSGFSKSERMREVVRRRHVLRQKGRGRKKRRKLPKSSSLQSSRGVRIRRCGQGSRSRSSLSGAQCSLWSSTGLRCSASWPVCTRRTVMRSSFRQWHVQGSFCGYFVPCAVFLLWSLSAGPPPGRHHGRSGPEGHVRSWLVSLYGPLYLAVTCSIWFLPE